MLQITRANRAARSRRNGWHGKNGPGRQAHRRLPLVTVRPDNVQKETSASPLSSGDHVVPEEDMYHGCIDFHARRN